MVGVEVVGQQLNITAQYFDNLGSEIKKSVVEAALDILRELRKLVVFGYLNGEVLKKVSGKLASSIRTVAFAGRDVFTARLYQKVDIAPYGPVHEKGGTFTIPQHVRHLRNGSTTVISAHSATYPRRSYMERAMIQMAEQIKNRIAEAMQRPL